MKLRSMIAVTMPFLLMLASAHLIPVAAARAEAESGAAWISRVPWTAVWSGRQGRAGETLTDFDYGDPTAAEQGHLEVLNRSRMNPFGEAALFGIDLFEGVDPGDISGEPAQPLTFNAQLYRAAQLHSQDMLARQFFEHENPDNLGPDDRVTAQGYLWQIVGENLAARGSNAPIDEFDTSIQMHEDLFVDRDIPHRGHRVNLLNGTFKEVGIGIGFGQFDFNGRVFQNSYVLTADFGASRVDDRSFVLGVVIDDADGDGAYGDGEGVGGIEIAVVEADAKTFTASAGGYGIPVDPGTYTVEARDGDGRSASKQVTVGNRNVKVDFSLDEFGGGPMAPIATVMANGRAASLAVAAGETVSLDIGLDAGDSAGVSADWWFVWISGEDLFSFDVDAFDFLAGPLTPSLQETPLVGFAPFTILTVGPSPGEHLFCFGVDLDGNGGLDVSSLHFACVTVDVQ